MNFDWQNILYSLPGILLGLTVHEYCHAFAAFKLGDHTAKEQGRLTFNPLKHIDIIGFLFIIFAGFGWAKPVQFNPENLSRPRRDKAIIAAAGPLSNLVLALFFIALIKVWYVILESAMYRENYEQIFAILFSGAFINFISIIFRGAAINLGLFIFNLIPIPPLDGSHIVFSGLNIGSDTELKIIKIGTPLLFIILIIQNHMEITIIPIGKIISAILRLLIPQLR